MKKFLILFLVIPFLLNGQVQITSNDFLNLVGRNLTVKADNTPSFPINVGNPGTNQTWDFRNFVFQDSLSSVFSFYSPSSPNFPNANLAQKIVLTNNPTSEFYNFFEITSSSLKSIGDSVRLFSPTDTSIINHKNRDLSPLPMTYGASWSVVVSDSFGQPPAFLTIAKDSTHSTVDGWGTIRLPNGDFQCLRMLDRSTRITQTIVSGVVISETTETSFLYRWVTKTDYVIANVQSQFDETNLNFTDAQHFSYVSSLTGVTDVNDDQINVNSYLLKQNYPNPFNPSTTIEFSISNQSEVSITLHNVLGEKVGTIFNGIKSAGSHSVVFNSETFENKLTSGIYFYRLQSSDYIQTRKMILLK